MIIMGENPRVYPEMKMVRGFYFDLLIPFPRL